MSAQLKPTPAAETLAEAVRLFAERDRIKALSRANTEALRKLCREYDRTAGVWGTHPDHLERAARLQGFMV